MQVRGSGNQAKRGACFGNALQAIFPGGCSNFQPCKGRDEACALCQCFTEAQNQAFLESDLTLDIEKVKASFQVRLISAYTPKTSKLFISCFSSTILFFPHLTLSIPPIVI